MVFHFDADPRTIPLHIYKTRQQFTAHMGDYIRAALRRGPSGWEVTDCVVTMTMCGFYASDGRRKPVSPTAKTSAADFQGLTPLVVRDALERAGTVVCEPVLRLRIETPTKTVGAVMALLSKLGATIDTPAVRGDLATVEAHSTHATARLITSRLPPATNGEGALEISLDGYRPMAGRPRPRHQRATSDGP
jgi:ribosomal protection tetracycline resistance protein